MTAVQALLAAIALIGGVLIVAGAAVLGGPGWALLVAGTWATAAALLLYPAEQAGKKR